MTNKEKTLLIDALREKHALNKFLSMVGMAKSSYFYQREALKRADKHHYLRGKIIEVFNENQRCYGYRRLHAILKNEGMTVSEKTVRILMKEETLTVQEKKKRKYSSYLGEISPEVDNLVARDFHAEKPNVKWLSDLTEFHIPAGKVYLSPIIDCFDGLVVSWTIGTSPDAELVNTMLDDAVARLSAGECQRYIPTEDAITGGPVGSPGCLKQA